MVHLASMKLRMSLYAHCHESRLAHLELNGQTILLRPFNFQYIHAELHLMAVDVISHLLILLGFLL